MVNSKPINAYIYIISFLGWFGVFLSLFWLKLSFESLTISCLLLVFLFICEFFPISSGRGTLSFSFPLVFTFYIFNGLSFSVISFAIILFIIGFIRQQPFKQILFESGYKSLSLILSLFLTGICYTTIFYLSLKDILDQTIYVFTATGLYFLIKNGLYDVKSKLRKRTPVSWWKRNMGDWIVFIISFFYCWLMFFLGHQDRGKIDALSFFFFFTPLLAISIVSAIIASLEREKRRLKMLFSITNEFKQDITTSHAAEKIIDQLKKFLPIDMTFIWIKNGNLWESLYIEGEAKPYHDLDDKTINWVQTITETMYFPNRAGEDYPGFDSQSKSFIYAPLYIENDLIGVWGMGSQNAFAFQKDDILSIKALATQIAFLIRTRKLIQDQENHRILEERNRIAREIHDGIAQRVAGAVMNLEAANKSLDTRVDESRKLIQDSLEKLRGSLKDIRESIYALRPHPTQQVGIVQALQGQIETFKQENPNVDVNFHIKGKEIPLGYIIENAVFNVLREALRNIQKHSQATLVNITINFKESHIILRIKDNGLGFSLMDAMIKAKDEPHFGIINMHELAENMGGTLDISSKSDQGTEITLVIPIKVDEAGGSHD